MRRFVSVLLPLFLLAFFLSESATPALAQVKEGTEARNVLVKVSLNRQDRDGTKTSRSIQTVVRIDGAPGHVIESVRVPIPGLGEEGKTYTYQNVGFSLNVEARPAAGRSVLLRGLVEETPPSREPRPHRPSEPGPTSSARSS